MSMFGREKIDRSKQIFQSMYELLNNVVKVVGGGGLFCFWAAKLSNLGCKTLQFPYAKAGSGNGLKLQF